MNKGELVDTIAKEVGTSKALAGKVLDSIIGTVTTTLKKGDRVVLAGFGTFTVMKRKARTGRNPQTGKDIKIPAKKVAKFCPGVKLAKVVK